MRFNQYNKFECLTMPLLSDKTQRHTSRHELVVMCLGAYIYVLNTQSVFSTQKKKYMNALLLRYWDFKINKNRLQAMVL